MQTLSSKELDTISLTLFISLGLEHVQQLNKLNVISDSNPNPNSIFFSLPLSVSSPFSSPSSSSSRRIWLYNQADILLIITFLSSIPWTSILSSSDVDHSWLVFKHTFLKIMHLTIPSKIVSPPPHPPCISRSLLSSFKRRNFLYKRAKSTNPPYH